jgi:uncharacterized SAM-binding protein YcdF (DUF218 family)
MLFIVAKVFWALAQPVTLAFIMGLAAILAGFARFRKTALAIGLAALASVFITFYTSLGAILVEGLEDRFPHPATPSQVACVIVLGGGIATKVDTVRSGYDLDDGADRYIEAVRLAQTYPDARIIMSGGDGRIEGGYVKEATIIKRMFDAFKVDPARVDYDETSRDTYENAVNTRRILDNRHLTGCLLITSGWHMPRTVAIFRHLGMDVVPWVTDYRTTGEERLEISVTDPLTNATLFSIAAREWIGILAYYLTGRVDTLYPI